jgi:hypothetical protein
MQYSSFSPFMLEKKAKKSHEVVAAAGSPITRFAIVGVGLERLWLRLLPLPSPEEKLLVFGF